MFFVIKSHNFIFWESNVKYFVWIPFTKIKCLHTTLADSELHM